MPGSSWCRRGGVECEQDDKRVLVDVVVERAEKLRSEERREAALREQRELAAFPVRRASVHDHCLALA